MVNYKPVSLQKVLYW